MKTLKKNSLLLKTLLKSTSLVNIYKHTTDKKKKSKISGAFIGLALLYGMLMAYSIATCIGYGKFGMIHAVPVICALTLSILAFVFTFIKTNGYLFNFKEYDMLMSLPFEARTVAACKFLYMFVKSLPWYLSISLAMMIGYGIYAKPGIIIYPIWIILTFFVPIIPMLVASFLGFIIARISSGFKKNNIIQTVLTFIFVLFCMSIQYIVDALVKNDKVEATFDAAYKSMENIASIYLPAKWFASSITDASIIYALLLIALTVVLFYIVFVIVGNSYRNINSALKSHHAAKNYEMTSQKRRSVVNAIAYKEFKRLTGSAVYLVNDCLGEVLSVMLGIAVLIFGFDKIVSVITKGAPIDAAIIQPAIPFIVYFLVGMTATTAASPSLEGKNYWIVQSLPISKKTLYQGKMLFNMYLTLPFMALATICLCISAKVSLLNTVLYLILGSVLCAFSTAWGCVCGIKHMRLDWENEVEIVKQSAAVAIYMLPNMFVVMGLTVLVVFLGMKVDHILLALMFTAIAGILAVLSYLRVMSLAKK